MSEKQKAENSGQYIYKIQQTKNNLRSEGYFFCKMRSLRM
jgi:hypothetical protein